MPILFEDDFAIIPMNAYHSDDWSERLVLNFGPKRSEVILDGTFAHHVAHIAAEEYYALVETDYFGGAGDQVAAAYKIGEIEPLFASERKPSGAINTALKKIGVKTRDGLDEFDTLKLGNLRSFEDYFEKYYE